MEYDKLDLIQQKAKYLLNDLREDKDGSNTLACLYILVILYVICLSILYIMKSDPGYIKFVIYLVLLLGLLIMYRIRMSEAFRDSNSLSSYTKIDPADKANYTSGLLKYLSSGYNVKIVRIKTVRLIYTILLPLLIVLIGEVWQIFFSEEYVSSGFWHHVFAFAICSPIYFFFGKDIEQRQFDKEDVDTMVRKIHL